MASGHASRVDRPNTWLLRPDCDVKKVLANTEPSTRGIALGVYGSPAGREVIEPRLQVSGQRPLLDGSQAVGELLGPAGTDDRRCDGRIGQYPGDSHRRHADARLIAQGAQVVNGLELLVLPVS